MSISAPVEIVAPEDVLAEVRRKSAEVEFQSFRETVIDHFQDAKSIAIYLLEDPDEEDRNWVVFRITFPKELGIEAVEQKRCRFYEDLGPRCADIVWPICALSCRFG